MRFQGSELDVLQVEPDVGSGPTVIDVLGRGWPLENTNLFGIQCEDHILAGDITQK